jgi:hypothetical protein
MKDSQMPFIAETSSLPDDMSAVMTDDLPIVPAIMTV